MSTCWESSNSLVLAVSVQWPSVCSFALVIWTVKAVHGDKEPSLFVKMYMRIKNQSCPLSWWEAVHEDEEASLSMKMSINMKSQHCSWRCPAAQCVFLCTSDMKSKLYMEMKNQCCSWRFHKDEEPTLSMTMSMNMPSQSCPWRCSWRCPWRCRAIAVHEDAEREEAEAVRNKRSLHKFKAAMKKLDKGHVTLRYLWRNWTRATWR